MYEIEDNIPVPKQGKPASAETLTFQALEVGQSFEIGHIITRHEEYRIRNTAKNYGKKCSIRKINGVTRVWRTA
jgi:hypothetical protein